MINFRKVNEDDILKEDMDKLIEMYEKETDELNKDTENIKIHITKMLNELKNDSHQVITSLCVLIQKGEKFKEYLDYDMAEVYLKDMSEKEIKTWVKNGNPLDKAGAYAVQSEFCVFVDRINGNYTTVVGLPMHKLYDVIKDYI